MFTPKPSTAADPEKKDEPIVFKPTTPLFYSRLVRHAHILEFLSSELLRDDEKDRTFWVSHPKLFLKFFEPSKNTSMGILPTEEDDDDGKKDPILKRCGWQLLHFLRNHRPQPPSIHNTTIKNNKKQSDIRSFALSPLDHYTKNHLPPPQSAQYRNAVTKILLSDVVAFGFPETVDALVYLGRVGVSWGVVRGWKYYLG